MRKVTDDELRACVKEPDELRRMAETVLVRWSQDDLEKLNRLGMAFPPVPTEPGIYAMIASDGVMIRAVDSQATAEQVQSIVREDITHRVLVDEQNRLIAGGMSFESVFLTMLPKYLDLTARYRLEKLS